MATEHRGFEVHPAAWLRVGVRDTRGYDLAPTIAYFSSPGQAYAAIDRHLDNGWPLGDGGAR